MKEQQSDVRVNGLSVREFCENMLVEELHRECTDNKHIYRKPISKTKQHKVTNSPVRVLSKSEVQNMSLLKEVEKYSDHKAKVAHILFSGKPFSAADVVKMLPAVPRSTVTTLIHKMVQLPKYKDNFAYEVKKPMDCVRPSRYWKYDGTCVDAQEVIAELKAYNSSKYTHKKQVAHFPNSGQVSDNVNVGGISEFSLMEYLAKCKANGIKVEITFSV